MVLRRRLNKDWSLDFDLCSLAFIMRLLVRIRVKDQSTKTKDLLLMCTHSSVG